MKFSLFFVSALLGISSVVASPVGETMDGDLVPRQGGRESRPRPPPQGSGCVSKARAVPFYRAFNSQRKDHFYSTNANEIENLVKSQGYKSEGIAAYIFPSLQTDTVPMYRLYNPTRTDHIYTTSEVERRDKTQAGYRDEGVAGFIYEKNICGSEPFYRLVDSQAGDHFFTRSATERNTFMGQGYKSEGMAGYVLASNH